MRRSPHPFVREDRGSTGSCRALIRVGLPEDSRAIAKLIVMADSGVARNSSYLHWVPNTRATRIRELERIVRAPVRTWFHWSVFWVAEMDRRVVAALAAFTSSLVARATLSLALEEAGWDRCRIVALYSRTDALQQPCPTPSPDTWILHHLAVFPEARRLGLGRELLTHALEEGAHAGFTVATADVRSGNTPAVRVFTRAGFKTGEELPNPSIGGVRGDRGVTRMVYWGLADRQISSTRGHGQAAARLRVV